MPRTQPPYELTTLRVLVPAKNALKKLSEHHNVTMWALMDVAVKVLSDKQYEALTTEAIAIKASNYPLVADHARGAAAKKRRAAANSRNNKPTRKTTER